jgi:hypothetical protein
MRTTFHVILSIALSGILSNGVWATEVVSTRRIALLELFTSEGCNSCPPADRFISSLPRPELVPSKLVVLAFHVDYWNYLGWNDRFSQQRFSARQQQQVRANGLRTAYTPQLVLNGRDYRDTDGIGAYVERINTQASRIDLTLRAQINGSSVHLRARVDPVKPVSPEPMELYIALYENNLVTQVLAGENRGHRLRHDYVVRNLIGPVALTPEKSLRWKDQIALNPNWKRMDLGVAAFVQTKRSGEVLQATAQAIQ